MTRDLTATVTGMHRPAHLRALPMPAPRPGPVEWPRNAWADWCPQPLPTTPPVGKMIALTVFTTFRPPVAPGNDPIYAATCVCGDVWHSTSEGFMRRQLSDHRCIDNLGHAPGLLPEARTVDEPTGEILDRLLAGLRRLP